MSMCTVESWATWYKAPSEHVNIPVNPTSLCSWSQLWASRFLVGNCIHLSKGCLEDSITFWESRPGICTKWMRIFIYIYSIHVASFVVVMKISYFFPGTRGSQNVWTGLKRPLHGICLNVDWQWGHTINNLFFSMAIWYLWDPRMVHLPTFTIYNNRPFM